MDPSHVDFDLLKIRDAVAAVRTFAGDVSRTEAVVLLPYWSGYHGLNDHLRDAVLARFRARS